MSVGWNIRRNELFLIDLNGNILIPSVEDVYAALVEHRPTEPWIPIVVNELHVSRYPLEPVLVIDVCRNDIPTYSICASSRGVTVELELYDLKRGHVIAGQNWYPIEPQATIEILELLQTYVVDIGPAHSLKAFLSIRKAPAIRDIIDDRIGEKIISPLVFAPKTDDVPTGIIGQLYPYQLTGWRWLKFLLSEGVGGLLADEMGLGKTLQIISVISDSGASQLSPALIVAPGSLLENWYREIKKFAPHLKVLKHHGPVRTGRPATLMSYDVVLISYDNVVTDSSLLNMILWRVVILDEAQFIRNPYAKRTRAVKRLRRVTGLAITGTPIENKLLDMWSIIDFVFPGYLGDVTSFETEFQDSVDGAIRLEPIVSPLMLRRRIIDVAQDLPPRIEIPQVLEIDENEAVAYDAERNRISSEYGVAATLVSLTSLRRFCAHPILMNGNLDCVDPMSFSKFRRLNDILNEIFINNEKVIIFTSFTIMADLILQHIQNYYGFFVGIIDGRLAIDERQPLIDIFSKVDGCAALVLNPKAGGAGLNITAANHVIHYNLEWNPALEDQASARVYRRGQKRPVTIHKLLISNTVEEVVAERLARKRELSSVAVIGIKGKDDDYSDIIAALSRSPSKVFVGK
ncbi:DEAD/DEAH box helicase [Limnobaculum zhutongyuii]|uniref:DEAD/DEAH box helicase n=1 Tax=Limnobaculum zhutongyuii TaxID=2498113 RepID=A0A411WLY4_9GAMM|nr:DEAD/DEAH box helicase [Limnobaculum zhutongyuii]QBH97261.1 DEAD/DEAH box helicase [Limnobaculum zhutongyuii]TQS88520.1 DEAD/DEAH box helicase [Limnobaculum zhutongyuii]